jgi:hypothetical protein
MPIVGILTDFGTRGHHYVAEMKGVALGINPDLHIIDVSHSIHPYSIVEAAYMLYAVYKTFPKGSIFVCVVDPGVGSERDVVVLQTIDDYLLIGPDNGLFSFFTLHEKISLRISITETEFYYSKFRESLKLQRSQTKLEDNLTSLAQGSGNGSKLFLGPLETSFTSTFHGRDIMMPVAAHLSLGLDIFALGEPKTELVTLPNILPELSDDHRILEGMILYIDDFGNAITNLPINHFRILMYECSELFQLRIGDRILDLEFASIFSDHDPKHILFIPGSSGFMEICQNMANAAKTLQLQVKTLFKIEFLEGDLQKSAKKST